MGLLDAIQTGRRGLAAASAGIEVTSQNVANVGTAGYTRRKLLQSTTDPVQRRGLWYGSGPRLDGVARATDRLLGVRLVASAGAASQAATLHEALSAAEASLGEAGTTDLSDANAAFWDSLSALTADPSDTSARRAVVAAAGSLASTVSRVATALDGAVADLDGALAGRLDGANAKLAEVAALNKAIGRAGLETGPADLLDRRDLLVRELGEEIGATVDLAADGQATVFVGGHAVVSGGDARALRLGAAADGSPEIGVTTGSGAVAVTREMGGAVGGSLAARATVQGWVDALDTFATTLAGTLNAAHAAGFDAAGTPGGDVFTFDASAPAATFAVSSALADPAALALAGASTAEPGDGANLAALLDLEGAAVFAGGTLTAGEALTDLASRVGAEVATAEGDAASFEAQLADVDAMHDALASVDTDEEAIRLVEYQTAYRAAARVLSVGDEMLRTLLSLGGP